MKTLIQKQIKSLICFSLILGLLLAGFVYADSLKPFVYTFNGRWQPAENAALIDPNGFQDIQNLRKDGKKLEGVLGHSKINSSVWNSTYKYPKNGFHFKKDQPAESHVMILGALTDGSEGQLFENTTAIPSAGAFSGTTVYSDSSGAGLGRFASAPQGQMIYANGEESLIWGGDESFPVAFQVNSTSGLTDEIDYSSQVRNDLQTADEVAVIGGGIDSNTVLMLHMDGTSGATTFTDSSDSAHTVTPAGDAQVDIDHIKFGSGSLLGDGTGDYLSIADHANWNFGSDEFTVDFWVRLDDLDNQGLWQQFSGETNYQLFYYDTVTDNLKYSVMDAGSLDISLDYDVTLSANTWHHIALIRGWNGGPNRWAITVDGTVIDTEDDASSIPDLAAVLTVGLYGGPSYYLDGRIDEFRVTKGVARWIANFTPPARPYSAESHYFVVGYYRPLQGIKLYVDDGNTEASTMSAWEWTGNAWSSLSITDNTDSGASLAATGTVTFSSTESTSKPKFYSGLHLYWYQFYVDAGNATIYKCTVDAPMQDIKNIWNGDSNMPLSFNIYNGGAWEDYTIEVQTDSTEEYDSGEFAAVFKGYINTEYAYIGSTEQLTALRIGMGETINGNAATITVYYWNGSTWVSVGTVTDDTSVGGNPLSSNGFISWNAPGRDEEFEQSLFAAKVYYTPKYGQVPYKTTYGSGEWETKVTSYRKEWVGETKHQIRLESPTGYYYKLMWSAALTANTSIDTIECVPAPRSIDGYKFPTSFKNRAWLFSQKSENKNQAIYSQFNTPDIWNGEDAGELYFGSDEELTAAASIYNVYRTTGYEQLIVTKSNETYRVVDSSDGWEVSQMSGNIGCIAPLSMAVCEIAEVSEGTQRHVAIWQSANGVVMCDGASIMPISQDIDNYWDPNDSTYIPASQQDDSVGWYDPELKSYKLLISSGSGVTNLNVELEYSLQYNEWTKIYRENGSGANPLQCGFQVHDTDGNVYTFGATDEGTMYRLENGNTWDSTGIEQYVQTKNLMLDQGNGEEFFNETTIDYMRLLYEDSSSGATIATTHYADDVLTTSGVSNQDVPDSIALSAGPWDTQSCTLGPAMMHSLKFSTTTTDVANGMKLLGLGLYYDSYNTITEN